MASGPRLYKASFRAASSQRGTRANPCSGRGKRAECEYWDAKPLSQFTPGLLTAVHGVSARRWCHVSASEHKGKAGFPTRAVTL
jgi:hypothetical protein